MSRHDFACNLMTVPCFPTGTKDLAIALNGLPTTVLSVGGWHRPV